MGSFSVCSKLYGVCISESVTLGSISRVVSSFRCSSGRVTVICDRPSSEGSSDPSETSPEFMLVADAFADRNKF